jgi:hypothetical protein
MYYADTTVYRDRLDESNQNYTTIVDFQNFRQYIILEGSIYYFSTNLMSMLNFIVFFVKERVHGLKFREK